MDLKIHKRYVTDIRRLSDAGKLRKLWRFIKKNKMKKSELATAAEISDYAMTKLNKDESVSLGIIMRICKVFHCDVGDVVEVIEDI